ncbi:hypothetical protein, partial [Pseudomonas sp. B329]|uniref:hypothetical protein n=1 Tax=Pseudomonas sp. B329 TaxID=1553459 RepID=UPI0020055109
MTELESDELATQWAVAALINALNKTGNEATVTIAKEEVFFHLELLGNRPGTQELKRSLQHFFGR